MARTITVEKTLYKFSELSEKAKERARAKHAEFLGNWHTFTCEDAKVVFAFAGFEITDINFRGFWSQGDGACFQGVWQAANVSLQGIKGHAPLDMELHRITRGLRDLARKFPKARVDIRRGSSNYCHEYTPSYDFSLVEEDDWGRTRSRKTPAQIAAAEKEFIDLARAAMRWIYRTLEQDYEYQTSDEAIEESSEANGWEYEADGSLA